MLRRSGRYRSRAMLLQCKRLEQAVHHRTEVGFDHVAYDVELFRKALSKGH